MGFSAFSQRGGRDSNPLNSQGYDDSPTTAQGDASGGSAAGGAKSAKAGRRSTAGVGDRLRVASFVALPAQSPLLALLERIGQAEAGELPALGVELERLCRGGEVAA